MKGKTFIIPFRLHPITKELTESEIIDNPDLKELITEFGNQGLTSISESNTQSSFLKD